MPDARFDACLVKACIKLIKKKDSKSATFTFFYSAENENFNLSSRNRSYGTELPQSCSPVWVVTFDKQFL